jgi:hypothetical protein
MREKSEARKNEIDEREIEALGDYNAFSRPKNSAVSLFSSRLSVCISLSLKLTFFSFLCSE